MFMICFVTTDFRLTALAHELPLSRTGLRFDAGPQVNNKLQSTSAATDPMFRRAFFEQFFGLSDGPLCPSV